MIVELAAIGSVSVVASLAYTARIVRLALEAEKAWIPPPPPPPRLSRTEEKRRILERDRREWAVGLGTPRHGPVATKNVARIDAALLALADETDGNVDP